MTRPSAKKKRGVITMFDRRMSIAHMPCDSDGRTESRTLEMMVYPVRQRDGGRFNTEQGRIIGNHIAVRRLETNDRPSQRKSRKTYGDRIAERTHEWEDENMVHHFISG